MAKAICPECKAGKHGNCDGMAWDFKRDQEAECFCAEEGHEEES
jgi:hypothetical protein